MLGAEVVARFAHGLLLQDPAHLFAGDISKDDQSGLALIAKTASFIAADAKRAATISRTIAGGQWKKLGPQFASFGSSAPQAAAASVILLFLPACAADAFATRVVHQLPPTAKGMRLASSAMLSETPTWTAMVDPAKASLDQLQRFAAHTALTWSGNSERFAFGMEQAANKQRTARFAQVLEGLASEPKGLAEVLASARAGSWSKANDAASAWHKARGIAFGETVTVPPALADFLLAALIPGCYLSDMSTLLKAAAKG